MSNNWVKGPIAEGTSKISYANMYKLTIAAHIPNDYTIAAGYSDNDGKKIGRHGYEFIGSLDEVIVKLNKISQTHQFSYITIEKLDASGNLMDIVFSAHDIDTYGNQLTQLTVDKNKIQFSHTEPFLSQVASKKIYADPANLDFFDDFNESFDKVEKDTLAEEFKVYENLWK